MGCMCMQRRNPQSKETPKPKGQRGLMAERAEDELQCHPGAPRELERPIRPSGARLEVGKKHRQTRPGESRAVIRLLWGWVERQSRRLGRTEQ